jgi:hypothetical protein
MVYIDWMDGLTSFEVTKLNPTPELKEMASVSELERFESNKHSFHGKLFGFSFGSSQGIASGFSDNMDRNDTPIG